MSDTHKRSAATRLHLLDVTGTILATEGYGALNENYLCKCCGVTRGALRYHFPAGRYDLLPAFAEMLLARQVQSNAPLEPLSARERVYLLLIRLNGSKPPVAMVALMKLWIASRSDSKLAVSIQAVIDKARAQMLGLDEAGTDPEVHALCMLAHGACLHAGRPNFVPARVQAAIGWLLEELPPPPSLIERLKNLNPAPKSLEQCASILC